MKQLQVGDALLPDRFNVDEFTVSFNDCILTVKIIATSGETVVIQASGVLAYRISLEEVYNNYIVGSLNQLLAPSEPSWGLRYLDEDNPFGDFVRKHRFFHLNIPDVAILECWALDICQTS